MLGKSLRVIPAPGSGRSIPRISFLLKDLGTLDGYAGGWGTLICTSQGLDFG